MPSETSLFEQGHQASRLAHEIRNPLNAMRMQAAVIRLRLDRSADPDLKVARDQLCLLEQEINRLERLVHSFLETEDKPSDTTARVQLAKLIHQVCDFARLELEANRAELQLSIEANASEIQVQMDETGLHQVLLNLIQNAEQAIPDAGCITVGLRRGEDGQALLFVEDTGVGIADDVLPRIFEPFYSTRENGDGLGLEIARELVEKAGGQIRVDSQVGCGTRFEVLLPILETQC